MDTRVTWHHIALCNTISSGISSDRFYVHYQYLYGEEGNL